MWIVSISAKVSEATEMFVLCL